MIYLLAICFGAAATITVWRHLLLKRELRRLAAVLNTSDFMNTYARLTLETGDPAVRALAEAVNGRIDQFHENARGIKRAEQEIRYLLTHLSHDLRTPLTSLLGYLRLIEPDSENDYLRIVESKALVLKTLIEELYAFSLLESGEYAYAPERIPSVSALVEDTLTEYADEIGRVFGEPVLSLPENMAVMADRAMLDRVFRNIIQNAVKYGCEYFSVTAEMEDTRVFIRFTNRVKEGIMPDAARLFERFYRADGARGTDGYGLGLSAAHKMMEIMGGTIRAECGREFSVTLALPRAAVKTGF